MALQTYGLHAGRLEKYKGRMLAHAQPTEVLTRQGRQIRMPKNNSRTYVMRRFLPHFASSTNYSTQNLLFQNVGGDRVAAMIGTNRGAGGHQLAEGSAPPADTITPVDVTVTLLQYGCLYSYSDLTAELYEDNIPEQMVINCGERVTLVNEMIVFGELKSCLNQFFTGGNSTATVNAPIDGTTLQSVVASIQRHHGREVNMMLKPGEDFGTTAISSGYFCFCHTDAEPDLRKLPGFTPRERYANAGMTPMPNEIGAWERFRFITSPDLPSQLGAGAAVGATGLKATLNGRIDVYSMIVLAKEAFCQVAVRGMASIDTTFIPHNVKQKPDPLGQIGYVGAKWLKGVQIENDAWMAVIQCGVTNL